MPENSLSSVENFVSKPFPEVSRLPNVSKAQDFVAIPAMPQIPEPPSLSNTTLIDKLKKISFPTTNPTAFAIGMASALVTMMLSISFDPLKGKIIIPGAEDFLKAANSNFISLTSPPSIISVNISITDENILLITSTVNVNSIETNFNLQIADNIFFDENLKEYKRKVSNSEDEKIVDAIEIADVNKTIYYRVLLSNINGDVTSQIYSIKPNTIIINNKDDNREI